MKACPVGIATVAGTVEAEAVTLPCDLPPALLAELDDGLPHGSTLAPELPAGTPRLQPLRRHPILPRSITHSSNGDRHGARQTNPVGRVVVRVDRWLDDRDQVVVAIARCARRSAERLVAGVVVMVPHGSGATDTGQERSNIAPTRTDVPPGVLSVVDLGPASQARGPRGPGRARLDPIRPGRDEPDRHRRLRPPPPQTRRTLRRPVLRRRRRRAIHQASRGYPRAVNNLAVSALAASKSIVDLTAAQSAITENSE